MKSMLVPGGVFAVFALLGWMMYAYVAMTAVSGGMYWMAFVIMGYLAARKARSCTARSADAEG